MALRRSILVLAALLSARAAGAHNVPVLPSTCAFDPLEVDAPASGVAATAPPSNAPDGVHTTYDMQDQTAQFTLQSDAARPFVAGGTASMLELPSFFVALLRSTGARSGSTGEFIVPDLPLGFTVGGAALTLPMTLTTGLTAVPGLVLEGSPRDANGRYTLVGVVQQSGLPSPLGGVLVVRASCQATPVPDKDQFRRSTDSVVVSAGVTSKTLTMRVLFAPNPDEVLDFPGKPAIFRASTGGVTIGAGAVLGGLRQRGRRLFVASSDDRLLSMGVRFVRRRFQIDNYLLAVKLRAPVLPAPAGTPVAVQTSYAAGGLLGRSTDNFRVKAHGKRLAFP
jgi:hypothetical protein